MGNTSLIIGTIFSQLAVGTFITAFIIDKVMGKAGEKGDKTAALVSFIIGCLGLVGIITHLGVPLHAFNAMLNLGTSWLSRETIFYGGFLALLALYILFTWKGGEGGLGKPLGYVVAIVGICLLIVSALIYTIPGVPAWNTINTPVSFALSAFLMGIPLGTYLCGGYKTIGNAASICTAIVCAIAFFTTLVYVFTLASGNTAGAATAYLLSGDAKFIVRMILLGAGAVCGGYMGIKALKKENDAASVSGGIILGLFVMMAVSEVMGRYMFFDTIVRFFD